MYVSVDLSDDDIKEIKELSRDPQIAQKVFIYVYNRYSKALHHRSMDIKM